MLMFKYVFFLTICCSECGISELLGKRLGVSCKWEGRAGKCVPLHKCRSAMEDIRQKNPPPIDVFYSSHIRGLTLGGRRVVVVNSLKCKLSQVEICAFEDINPIICCTDCDAVDDTRQTIYDPDLGILHKVDAKAEDQCYNYLKTLDYPCKKTFNYTNTKKPLSSQGNCSLFTDRYSYANDTVINSVKKQFPHMAYLGYGESLDKADWLCGGTVISDRFILTAAECVDPDISTGSVKFVALGIHKRWVRPTEWQRYNVKRAILHPEYKAPSKYHDIALLETDMKITFGPNVLPACIDSENKINNNDLEANTLIWSEGKNGTLDIAALGNFDELLCSIFYPPQDTLANGYNHTIQMCLGDREKPKDSCDGEIGFPLQSSFKTCFQMIKGIASFKRQCGEAGGSGLFTRVSYYRPWIESIVWP